MNWVFYLALTQYNLSELLKCSLHLQSCGKEVVYENIKKWFGMKYPWSEDRFIKDSNKRLSKVSSSYELHGNILNVGQTLKKQRRSSLLNTSYSENTKETDVAEAPITKPVEAIVEQILNIIEYETEEIQLEAILGALDHKRANSSSELLAFTKIKEVNFDFFFVDSPISPIMSTSSFWLLIRFLIINEAESTMLVLLFSPFCDKDKSKSFHLISIFPK